MKYRLLSVEELEGFKDEFINFLIVNGIDATLWVSLKSNEPEKANGILASFSDFIFEKILNKIQYLEFFNGNNLLEFQCGEKIIKMIALESTSSYDTPDQMLEAMIKNSEGFQIYQQEKEYNPNRNLELFRMAESGSKISDEKLFVYLSQLIEKK